MLKLEVENKERLRISSHGDVERPITPSKFTMTRALLLSVTFLHTPWSHVENEGPKYEDKH